MLPIHSVHVSRGKYFDFLQVREDCRRTHDYRNAMQNSWLLTQLAPENCLPPEVMNVESCSDKGGGGGRVR